VAAECLRLCYRCYWCKRGEYASCLNQVSIGQMDDGGMAEYVVVPAENCISIPDDMPEDGRPGRTLAVIAWRRKGRVMAGMVTVVGAGRSV
jgi:threonine dehydrogenase-like Zn-dependent dehydrogenase